MNSFGFDLNDSTYSAENNAPSGDYSPIPPGVYTLLIDAAEIKQTRAGDDMLKITLRVDDGEFAGRLLWENLVYGHSSEKVQNIARSKMAAMQRALGKECKGPDDFVGGVFQGKVGISPASGNYGPSNRLDRVVEGGAATQSAPAAPAQPSTTNGGAKPW